MQRGLKSGKSSTGGGRVGRVKRGRSRGRDRESLKRWIKVIDQHLTRYFDDLPRGEVKLADYLKLADVNLFSARTGRKKVVVRWVNCDEKEQQTEMEDEAK